MTSDDVARRYVNSNYSLQGCRECRQPWGAHDPQCFTGIFFGLLKQGAPLWPLDHPGKGRYALAPTDPAISPTSWDVVDTVANQLILRIGKTQAVAVTGALNGVEFYGL